MILLPCFAVSRMVSPTFLARSLSIDLCITGRSILPSTCRKPSGGWGDGLINRNGQSNLENPLNFWLVVWNIWLVVVNSG